MSSLRESNRWELLVGLIAGVMLIASALPGGAVASPLTATAPTLGTGASYAVMGGSTVTNTGATVITGDLGVSPGSAVTGFPPGIVAGGAMHKADAAALQAQNDIVTAYNNLAGQAVTVDLTGQDLGGKTLTPGVYSFSSSAQLTGALTLNALGDGSAVFVFKMGSTLTTASNASVSVINGGTACNVFWLVGSSATLGTGTKFVGSILALTSISLNTGASLSGRALARNGAVTLDTNTISSAQCSSPATAVPATATSAPAAATTVPPTATSAPAAAAPVRDTATAVPTATTAVPSTATSVPATSPANAASPVPSTAPADTPTSATTSAPTVVPTTVPTAQTGVVAVATPTRVTPTRLPNTGDAGGPGFGWLVLATLMLMLLTTGFLFRRASQRM